MSSKDIVVKVEHVSKRYRIGLKEEMNDSIGSAMLSFFKSPLKKTKIDIQMDRLKYRYPEILVHFGKFWYFSPNITVL